MTAEETEPTGNSPTAAPSMDAAAERLKNQVTQLILLDGELPGSTDLLATTVTTTTANKIEAGGPLMLLKKLLADTPITGADKLLQRLEIQLEDLYSMIEFHQMMQTRLANQVSVELQSAVDSIHDEAVSLLEGDTLQGATRDQAESILTTAKQLKITSSLVERLVVGLDE